MAAEAAEAKNLKVVKEGADSAPSKKSGEKLPFFTLLIVLLNTAVLATLGYLVTQLWQKMKLVTEREEQLEQTQKKQESVDPKADPAKEFIPPELGVLYPLDNFLVNIASDRGPKFLQMQMELELDNPALEDELALKRPAVRDAVILLLTSRTFAELRDKKGIEKLRFDLIRSINGLLKTGNVKGIYFTQFHFN